MQSIMSISEDLPGLSIDPEHVKKLVLGDTVSYSISLKPQTPKAVAFQNLTIQTINGITTAFLTTYYPSNEWILDWKKDRHLGFKGSFTTTGLTLLT
jgi:hypothetical protein